ncbi:UNVERIFIED_CONTAM: Ferruginol synthase [Sesamum radiatum]|uniref:Ferruginol synthase n=1 Tax=Sesamum radiatum TaxID=300843 RepID=A0AAW2SI14_SESRA
MVLCPEVQYPAEIGQASTGASAFSYHPKHFPTRPKPHQSLAELSKTYGPLMSLQLGSIYTVVVSSPELAKEVLQKHDQVFSGRTIAAAAQVHDHHKISMAYLPVGKEWRTIRKICKEQMFSTYRLDASQGLR